MLHGAKEAVLKYRVRTVKYLLSGCRRRSMSGRKLQVAVDFDGTLTVSDTMSALASVSHAPDASFLWKTLSDEYKESFDRHMASHVPGSERSTLTLELEHLRSLRDVQSSSFHRVKRSALFSGVTVEDVRKGAAQALQRRDVQMRPGWGEFVQFVTKTMGSAAMVVVSVNFSTEWIRAVLLAGIQQQKSKDLQAFLSHAVQSMPIYANEALSVGNDSMEEPICTSAEKLDTFKGSTTASKEWLKLYIGDSTTDLECLLAADIGICVRNIDEHSSEIEDRSQRELNDVCKRVGISVDRLSLMTESDIHRLLNRKVDENRLWWAKDFHEVLHWLKRLLYVPPEDWLKMRWDAYNHTK